MDLSDTRPPAGRFKVEGGKAEDTAPRLSRYSSLPSTFPSAPKPILPHQIPSRRQSNRWPRSPVADPRNEFRLT